VPTARIGRPIAVTDRIIEIPFRDDVDQAVALTGTGDMEATAVLGAAVETATAGWEAASRVIVLDGRPESADGADPILGAALARARVQVDIELTDDGAGAISRIRYRRLRALIRGQAGIGQVQQIAGPCLRAGPAIQDATPSAEPVPSLNFRICCL